MDGKQIIALVLGIMASSCTDKPSSNKLQDKLNELKNSATPNCSAIVTCYYPAPQEPKAVYTCPVCGKQTVYLLENDKRSGTSPLSAEEIINSISSIENYREDIPKALDEMAKEYNLRFSFDESGFCEHCNPSGKPQLALKVTHPDNRTVSTPIQFRDIILLTTFFENKDTFFDEPGENKALKNEAKRIAELLGLSL